MTPWLCRDPGRGWDHHSWGFRDNQRVELGPRSEGHCNFDPRTAELKGLPLLHFPPRGETETPGQGPTYSGPTVGQERWGQPRAWFPEMI